MPRTQPPRPSHRNRSRNGQSCPSHKRADRAATPSTQSRCHSCWSVVSRKQGVVDPPRSRDVVITLGHHLTDASWQFHNLLEKSLRPSRPACAQCVVRTSGSFPSSHRAIAEIERSFKFSDARPPGVASTVGANATTVQRAVLAKNRLSQIICTVKKDSVTVTCDGRELIHWQGEPQRLSLSDY